MQYWGKSRSPLFVCVHHLPIPALFSTRTPVPRSMFQPNPKSPEIPFARLSYVRVTLIGRPATGTVMSLNETRETPTFWFLVTIAATDVDDEPVSHVDVRRNE